MSDAASSNASFFAKVRSEIKVFANVTCILDKIEQDGNFLMLSNMFQQIFKQEIVYAVYGELNRAEAAEGQNAGTGHSKPAVCEHVYLQGQFEADCGKFDRVRVEGEGQGSEDQGDHPSGLQ